MSLIVDQLESYDRSNLEVIRIEFAKLQRKLEKCQDDKEDYSNAQIGRLILIFWENYTPLAYLKCCI